MKTSESVVNITKALLAAQEHIKHASKTKQGQFSSKYATLEDVIDASKEHLYKNGIIVIQGMTPENHLVTRLQHSSGEFFETSMKLMLDKQTMQGIGSSVSYGRRYSLAAMTNIAQVDDDAARSTKETEDAAKYTFKAGANEGKCLHDMSFDEIKSYLSELKSKPKKNDVILETIKMMDQYLKEYGK